MIRPICNITMSNKYTNNKQQDKQQNKDNKQSIAKPTFEEVLNKAINKI